MFIETHDENITNGDVSVPLAFIKSTNVQAYPCGRRRSELAAGGSTRIPFDPEARLNTEANNRKHSGVNGYKQTYLKSWDDGLLAISLAGYLFNITLPDGYSAVGEFGAQLTTALTTQLSSKVGTDASKLYANILIEDAHLFSGFQEYFTGVLRNQSGNPDNEPEDALDLLSSTVAADATDKDKKDKYYFSGLSFSTTPLTVLAGDEEDTRTIYEKVRYFDRDNKQETRDVKQTFVSLCILEKSEDSNTWKIHEPARLPLIEHDTLEDSIVVGETRVRHNLRVEKDATIYNKTNTADLEVTDEAAVRTTLSVQNNSNNAQANIDRADIEYADIADTYIDIARIDNATIDSLTVPYTTGGATSITEDGIDTQYIDAIKADVAVLKVQGEGSSATIDTATITTELHVENENSNAKAYIDSADLVYADIEDADIDEADITTLRVQGDGSSATIDVALVTNTLTAHNDERTALVETDKIQIPYGTSAGTYTDITNTGLSSPFARIAKIETTPDGGVTLQGNNVTAKGEVKASDFYQTVGNAYMKVPVIELKDLGTGYYQLQISRVGQKEST